MWTVEVATCLLVQCWDVDPMIPAKIHWVHSASVLSFVPGRSHVWYFVLVSCEGAPKDSLQPGRFWTHLQTQSALRLGIQVEYEMSQLQEAGWRCQVSVGTSAMFVASCSLATNSNSTSFSGQFALFNRNEMAGVQARTCSTSWSLCALCALLWIFTLWVQVGTRTLPSNVLSLLCFISFCGLFAKRCLPFTVSPTFHKLRNVAFAETMKPCETGQRTHAPWEVFDRAVERGKTAYCTSPQIC